MHDEQKRRHRKETGRQLAARVADGDEQAFFDLYNQYYVRVRAFALRRVSNSVDADDIAQEVFLQIYRSIGSYQGRSSFSTWIFGIAHNVTCRFYRKQHGVQVPIEHAEFDPRLSVSSHEENRIDAARALARCDEVLDQSRTPEHRSIFERFYTGGQPMRVIADSLGCGPEAVKHSLRRSRDAMLRDVPDLRTTLLNVVA